MVEIAQATVDDVVAMWPFPAPDSHKYTRGVVGLDTGSARYLGAALLGCAGALHAGAGMVRYLGEAPAELVLVRYPSVVVADGRVQAMVLGSGWGDVDGAGRLAAAVGRDVPLVLDADALALLPTQLPAGCLLTPHAGELARMLRVDRGEVERNPVASALVAADRFGAAVLLKGATQYVATPDGSVRAAVPGPAWTAQAGSGDVLAGVCGALLATGLDAADAAVAAASLQALAAAQFPGPHPPDRLASRFADILGQWAPMVGP